MTGMESEVSIPQEDPASECNYLLSILEETNKTSRCMLFNKDLISGRV